MATAIDYGSSLGTVGFVPYELMEGTQAVLTNVGSEMTPVSDPMDSQGGGAAALIVGTQSQHVSFSPLTDGLGSTVYDLGTSPERFEAVPALYKMRGYSTTLGQYVHWRSVGDALTPAPAEYGTVINVSSELIQ
jgi:hypothetical protein